MKMKKILGPPLAPLVILVLLLLASAIADRVGPPSVINGHADNAPRNAIFMLIVMTPLSYLLFVLLNALDAVFQRIMPRLRWFSTAVFTCGLGLLFASVLFRPEIDAPQQLLPVLCGSFLGAALMVVPMSVWRRNIEKGGSVEQSAAQLQSEGTPSD